MRRLLIALVAVFLVLSAKMYAEDDVINFPDPYFKKVLVKMVDYEQPEIDLNRDGEIQRSEAEAYKSTLWLSPGSDSITDLTGIKAFINVGRIWFEECPGITSVDLSGMVNLRQLTFDYNPNLEKFDVSGCINLTNIDCSYNILNYLNLLNCKNLFSVRCYNTHLSEFKIVNYIKLKYLFIQNNLISDIEIYNVPELWRFQLQGSQLTSLDASNLTKLDLLWVNDNKLKKLNIKNGNNALLTSFKANNNPDLKCITVDDATYSEQNWKEIDEWTEFSEDCSTSINDKPQNTFKVYPNPANNSVTIQREGIEQADLRILDITGRIYVGYTIPFGEAQTQLDISMLPAGKYILEINNVIKSLIIE